MRRVVRFESADGMHVLQLPLTRAEQEEGQSARLALLRPPLMNYAADLHGGATVVADVADIRHRAVLIDPDGADAALDRIRALLRRIGRGRLWMRLSDGTERWCWARAGELGQYQVSHDKPMETGLTITFTRLSDWYAQTQSEFIQNITASPTTFQIVSNGTVLSRQLEVEITADAASGFANPKLENLAAGREFTVSASSTAAGQKVRVTLSSNLTRRAQFFDGTSWSDVSVTAGPKQAELMAVVPGPQDIRVSGVTNGTVAIRWYDAYA